MKAALVQEAEEQEEDDHRERHPRSQRMMGMTRFPLLTDVVKSVRSGHGSRRSRDWISKKMISSVKALARNVRGDV